MAQVVWVAAGDIPDHDTPWSEEGLLDSLLKKVSESLSTILRSIDVDIQEIKDKICPGFSEA
jgi:hypothetical protein